jgi:uncharacterized protein YfiM (DUF2279 family)
VLELIVTALLGAGGGVAGAKLPHEATPVVSTQQPGSRLWPAPAPAPSAVVPQPRPQVELDGVLQASPETLRLDAGDAWLGSDKFQHFWVSFATTAFGFGAVRTAGVDSGAALYIAVPVAVAAGVGKEIHDRRRGGIFSVRDLVADGFGIAAAWLILREVR